MKFLVVFTVLIIGASMAQNLDINELRHNLAKYRADEISKWAATYLADIIKIPGDYYLKGFSTEEPKVGESSEYSMILDVSIKQEAGNVIEQSCEVKITDSALKNSRWFEKESVKCTAKN
ncbi:hypothetical protein BpHYR1_012352 [Brachionus plicatilis]|uniref:Uncharacterized protein n=1 Tax=Brachionus plicatilis TaxID=10195 RepID=A0A3M7Q4G6_BRAPC|nr:hypothetical protein BpHYR1_012352 [Brachionus plicatilis]